MSLTVDTPAIEKGSRVRVTFYAEYALKATDGHYIKHEDGGTYFVPECTTVTVVRPPLPPEPTGGSYVRAKGTRKFFRRISDVWVNVGEREPGEDITHSWEGLNNKYGKGGLIVLTTADL